MDDPSGVRGAWPAAVVCRAVPVALLAVGVLVPVLVWSALPRHRPGGWLLLAAAVAAAGVVVMAPLMRKPRGWAVERWDGTPVGFIGLGGLAMGWLRARFGPTATGLFALTFGAGLSVATTTASAHSSTWRLSPLGFVLSLLAAFGVAASCGLLVRRFGRLVDRQGRYVPPRPGGGARPHMSSSP